MRLMIINEKSIGKELAVPIYTQTGMIYLNKGCILNSRNIEQIKKIGINSVYIEDGVMEVTLQEAYDTSLRMKAIKDLKIAFNDCKNRRFISEKLILPIVEEIINNVNISENAYLYNNVAQNDEKLSLCIHSLNVAILSIMIGYNKKYNKSKLLKLGIGAILHDVGKLFTAGKEHPTEGYRIMKSNSFFSPTSCICVYAHHENEDGTGYPEKLKGDKIYEFAKIVAICNEYINIVDSNKAILPYEVIEMLTSTAKQKYSEDIYNDFIRSVYCYPNGLTVRLNSGEEAMVIKQNKDMPSRPIVAFKENGVLKLTNLIENLTIFIKEVEY